MFYADPTEISSVKDLTCRAPNFSAFLAHWDNLTDGYIGDDGMTYDGSPIAFERWRDKRVTSGLENSPCQYDVLSDLAARYLGKYVLELKNLRERMSRNGYTAICADIGGRSGSLANRYSI